jgi:hypothetical protein
MLLSLHAYRQGDYGQAMDLAGQSRARLGDGLQLPKAELSIILALTLNQLGNRPEALSELEWAESLVRTGFNLEYDQWHWRHWVCLRLLLAEAQASVRQESPPQPGAAPR